MENLIYTVRFSGLYVLEAYESFGKSLFLAGRGGDYEGCCTSMED